MVRFTYTGAALLGCQAASSWALALGDSSRPTATIDTGILIGAVVSEPTITATVNRFLGIPFAKPPARWALPEKPDRWQGSRDASQFGHACHQQFNKDKSQEITQAYFNSPPAVVSDSEDCLYLNVFAPASAGPGSDKAVMFWIHGGSNAIGTAALPLYEGSNIAGNQDVIVVTTNYRLNLFGFPSYPDIRNEEKNLGLHDQRLALDWVQRNIRSFGGDPNRVTIFGESAGGLSVDALVTAPPDPVPFAGAIIESMGLEPTIDDPEQARDAWNDLVSAAGCSSATNIVECMRGTPALRLLEIAESKSLVFGPSSDSGITFANSMRRNRASSLLNRKAIARVPILIGSNANEAFAYLQNGATLDDLVAKEFGNATGKLFLQTYRPKYKGYASPDARDEAIATDFVMKCPASRVAQLSHKVKIPTWRYIFNASFPNTEIIPGDGAYHSAELYPLFAFNRQPVAETPFQIETSKEMQKSWADFAKNPAGGLDWPQAPSVQILGGGARPGESDEGRLASKPVAASKADDHCDMYKTVYDAMELSGTLQDIINAILGQN